MLSVEELTIQTPGFSVRSASFRIGKGEYFFLLGASGSGKTLILEALTGIRRIKGGKILANGVDITHKPVNERDIGIVFQNLALFPHKTIFGNIAFPLLRKRIEKRRIREEVLQIAEKLSIAPYLNRYPGTLSGGEHQRVALARTLIMKPSVLLLDEPLSSLDILLKEEMINLLREVHQSGQTILHVTHDYHVVRQLAQRISIIREGEIIQTGTPGEIAREPSCPLAAKLRLNI